MEGWTFRRWKKLLVRKQCYSLVSCRRQDGSSFSTLCKFAEDMLSLHSTQNRLVT